MNTTELTKAIEKLAANDLAATRKRGYILVGQTRRGTVAIRHEAGTYTITTQGMTPEVLASGAPRVVRPVLAALYTVDAQ